MRRTTRSLAAIALLVGCSDEQIPTETTARFHPPASPNYATVAAQNKELATLMRVTAPFHDLAVAKAAGWSAQITPCMASPEGGMGFHYGNTALIDGTVRVAEPELLLYEPDPTGQLQLVAVEYIVPYTARSRSAAPPVLFGQQFKPNDAFQLWGLHVWVWKPNARGLFAPWNRQVSCGLGSAIAAMSH